MDWTSGGHKKVCEGIARARRDTNLEAQSRALARVSHMSGGAPDDARCIFCLDRGGRRAQCPSGTVPGHDKSDHQESNTRQGRI